MSYLEHARVLYDEAARSPDTSLCCTSAPPWRLPGLTVPLGMLERNYGCGSTVHPRELADARRVVYVGVGAGLEALQIASFVRRPGGVLAVDVSTEMLDVAGDLLAEARALNPWLTEDAVELPAFDDGKGHVLTRDVPLGVCDKTACALASLGRDDLVLTAPTWHYAGDGCC